MSSRLSFQEWHPEGHFKLACQGSQCLCQKLNVGESKSHCPRADSKTTAQPQPGIKQLIQSCWPQPPRWKSLGSYNQGRVQALGTVTTTLGTKCFPTLTASKNNRSMLWASFSVRSISYECVLVEARAHELKVGLVNIILWFRASGIQ